jgi:ADP-ribose pyrophosphatase YjhB (NUDIX family)
MWPSLPGAGALVVRDDRVLMVRHERSGRYRWNLPSGLVDAGETFEQAAERERLPETGVGVSQGENGGDDKQRRKFVSLSARHETRHRAESHRCSTSLVSPLGLEPRTR